METDWEAVRCGGMVRAWRTVRFTWLPAHVRAYLSQVKSYLFAVERELMKP